MVQDVSQEDAAMVFASMHSETHISKDRARQNWGLLEEFLIKSLILHACLAQLPVSWRSGRRRRRYVGWEQTSELIHSLVGLHAVLPSWLLQSSPPRNIRGKAVALSSCFIWESRAGTWTGSSCPAVLHPKELLKAVWHWLLSHGTGNSTVLNKHDLAGLGL